MSLPPNSLILTSTWTFGPGLQSWCPRENPYVWIQLRPDPQLGHARRAKKWPLAPSRKQLHYEMAPTMKELTVTQALRTENPLQSHQAENQEMRWKAKKQRSPGSIKPRERERHAPQTCEGSRKTQSAARENSTATRRAQYYRQPNTTLKLRPVPA